MLDHIFQQAVKRLPILCEMLRYLDTDFPHDKILGAVFFGKQGAAVFVIALVLCQEKVQIKYNQFSLFM